MSQQLPPEADQLGAPQAEYTANWLTTKIILGGDNVKNQSPHHNPVV